MWGDLSQKDFPFPFPLPFFPSPLPFPFPFKVLGLCIMRTLRRFLESRASVTAASTVHVSGSSLYKVKASDQNSLSADWASRSEGGRRPESEDFAV